MTTVEIKRKRTLKRGAFNTTIKNFWMQYENSGYMVWFSFMAYQPLLVI